MRAADLTSLYRAVWRWHFYAGLVVLPVLAWMTVTGSLYLYKPEIERWLYRDWIVLSSPASPLPLAEMIERVERGTGRAVTQVIRPAAEHESWRLAFTGAEGEAGLAFVRPDSGQILGTSRAGGPMELIKHLHSLTVAGPAGNILIEIVAGWAIVLVLTGLYLWWPRAGSRALSLAGRVGERRFWRNLHAFVGLLAGGVILFLAITGMPWTIIWGETFHALVAREQIGRPKAPVFEAAHEEHLPWSLRGQAPPRAPGHGDLGPDRAVAAATARGLAAPWILDLPAAPGRPYRLSAATERTDAVRVIYIDPGSARVLQDVRFADFGVGAQAFEWGIYTHQGGQYGEPNRLVMLTGCLGLLLLAVSAPVMWWKRRFRVPPAPDNPRSLRGVAAILLAVGLLFPLTGATMVAALAGGAALRRLGFPQPRSG